MAETWTVVQAPDVIEGATAVRLVRAALGAGSSVEIDMTGTEMLTSEGCTALLEISEVLTAEGASLVLRLGPSRIVREVLRITGLDAMFSIVDDAVQSVS
jgi:anti-anti-sigma regulatory factor